jgi:hypothetical protein
MAAARAHGRATPHGRRERGWGEKGDLGDGDADHDATIHGGQSRRNFDWIVEDR